MCRLETGDKLELTVEDGALVLPHVHTGHASVDSMIRKAWLGQYISTEQMLADAESLQGNIAQDQRGPVHHVSTDELRERVRRWKKNREENHGRLVQRRYTSVIDCSRVYAVLFCLGGTIGQLGHEYGYNIDEELRFRDYRAPPQQHWL